VSASRLLAAVVVGTLALTAQAASAATPTPPADPLATSTAPGLQVAPVHVTVPPGVLEYTTEFELVNPTARSETVFASVVELSMSGKLLASTIATADHWVKVDPTSAALAPREHKLFQVKVVVPEQREPAERRVGIVFLVKAPLAANGVAASIALVPSVWIPGSGPIVHLVKFGRLSAPPVADWNPIQFDIEVANLGNVHSDFGYGETTITGFTSAGSHFNFAPLTVLPNSTGVGHGVWVQPPPLCWCEVSVETNDGTGRIITSRARVLVVPVRILVGLLATMVGLFFLLSVLRRRAAARRLAELEAAREEGIRIGRSGGP
jgi:hypothetical protein